MTTSAQLELWSAEKVATHTTIATASNGLRFTSWAEARISHAEMEHLVNAVPRVLAPALADRCYYFVPLVLSEGSTVMVAPTHTEEMAERAICHRDVPLGIIKAVFLSSRLTEDRFGLNFEFCINVAHNFVDAIGVPAEFGELVWSQAQAEVRGETSRDAWDARRKAFQTDAEAAGQAGNERARKEYEEATFCDSLAIYMLSLVTDVDYQDLREREYPLLAAPALAERLRMMARLFPANEGYEFLIRYRRRS